MKKIIGFLLFFINAFLFAQIENSNVQVLIPKMVYIGDEAELKYIFHTDADLFFNKDPENEVSSLELNTDLSVFKNIEDKCYIKAVRLDRGNYDYTLTISFIPWYVGVIDFEPFDLVNLVKKSKNIEKVSSSYVIDFAPITINSLIKNTNTASLCPPAAPLVVPGTTAILLVFFIVFVIVVTIIIWVVVRISKIRFIFNDYRFTRYIKKLNKRTLKGLRKILKKTEHENDKIFCEKLVNLIRSFLCKRFTEDFNYVTTSHIYSQFEEFSCGKIESNVIDSVQLIIEVFERCDYIRFAQNSIDSKRQPASLYETVLGDGERELLVNKSQKAIIGFEIGVPDASI